MKHYFIKWMFWALLLSCGFMTLVYGQEDLERLDNGYFDSPRRPAVGFRHDEHNEKAELEDCSLCHHVYDEPGKKSEFVSSEDQACGDCHAVQDEEPMPGLRKAFHLRCKGCHLEVRQGPVACAQCHIKE